MIFIYCLKIWLSVGSFSLQKKSYHREGMASPTFFRAGHCARCCGEMCFTSGFWFLLSGRGERRHRNSLEPARIVAPVSKESNSLMRARWAADVGRCLSGLLGLLGEEHRVDVGEYAAGGDGHRAQELVELLVVADGQLDMAGDDAGLLVVTGGRGNELC